MNLSKKKELAKKTLGIGKRRILFDNQKLTEIKEAITKQDIKDLQAEGIITIKPITGRRTVTKRKTRRGPGKIKKTINKRKQIYVKMTRKLREYVKELRRRGEIQRDLSLEIRKKIRMRTFKSKAHLKEYLKNSRKIQVEAEKLLSPKKATKTPKTGERK